MLIAIELNQLTTVLEAVNDFYPQLISNQENSEEALKLVSEEIKLTIELFCEFDNIGPDACQSILANVQTKLHNVNCK